MNRVYNFSAGPSMLPLSVLEKAASELNFDKRKEYYDRYQEIIYQQRPLIYLYSQLRLIAVRNRIGNVCPTVLGGAVHNLPEIYVKQNK